VLGGSFLRGLYPVAACLSLSLVPATEALEACVQFDPWPSPFLREWVGSLLPSCCLMVSCWDCVHRCVHHMLRLQGFLWQDRSMPAGAEGLHLWPWPSASRRGYKCTSPLASAHAHVCMHITMRVHVCGCAGQGRAADVGVACTP